MLHAVPDWLRHLLVLASRLRVTGIEHPPPGLICSASHSAAGIVMSAPYATTVLNGRRVFSQAAGDPRTEIWFMLYAQVMQADGASYRNVLLTHARGVEISQLPFGPIRRRGLPLSAETPRAGYEFSESAIRDRLLGFGLSETNPLSGLAVELLPFDEEPADLQPEAANPTAATALADPLGAQLGTRRILRTSPLTAVPSVC
jgi:hypothetical protein